MVATETAARIVSRLPKAIERVGVFVNGHSLNPDEVRGVDLTALQITLPDSEPSSDDPTRAFGLANDHRSLKRFVAISVTHLQDGTRLIENLARSFKRSPSNPGNFFDTIFLDSGTSQQPGGTGRVFDWKKTAPLAETLRASGLKLVVAGGLTPANVAEAMDILNPWGVDVSSGVEASPGKKDPQKVRAFIRAVREADQKK